MKKIIKKFGGITDYLNKSAPHRAETCNNFNIGVDGSLQKRPGSFVVGTNPQPVGSNRIDELFNFNSNIFSQADQELYEDGIHRYLGRRKAASSTIEDYEMNSGTNFWTGGTAWAHSITKWAGTATNAALTYDGDSGTFFTFEKGKFYYIEVSCTASAAGYVRLDENSSFFDSLDIKYIGVGGVSEVTNLAWSDVTYGSTGNYAAHATDTLIIIAQALEDRVNTVVPTLTGHGFTGDIEFFDIRNYDSDLEVYHSQIPIWTGAQSYQRGFVLKTGIDTTGFSGADGALTVASGTTIIASGTWDYSSITIAAGATLQINDAAGVAGEITVLGCTGAFTNNGTIEYKQSGYNSTTNNQETIGGILHTSIVTQNSGGVGGNGSAGGGAVPESIGGAQADGSGGGGAVPHLGGDTPASINHGVSPYNNGTIGQSRYYSYDSAPPPPISTPGAGGTGSSGNLGSAGTNGTNGTVAITSGTAVGGVGGSGVAGGLGGVVFKRYMGGVNYSMAVGGAGGGGSKGKHGGSLLFVLQGSIAGTGTVDVSAENGYDGGDGGTGQEANDYLNYPKHIYNAPDTRFSSAGGGGGAGGSAGNLWFYYDTATYDLTAFTLNISAGTKGSGGVKGNAIPAGTDGADGVDGNVGTFTARDINEVFYRCTADHIAGTSFESKYWDTINSTIAYNSISHDDSNGQIISTYGYGATDYLRYPVKSWYEGSDSITGSEVFKSESAGLPRPLIFKMSAGTAPIANVSFRIFLTRKYTVNNKEFIDYGPYSETPVASLDTITWAKKYYYLPIDTDDGEYENGITYDDGYTNVNLFMNIARTKTSGSTYYLVDEIPITAMDWDTDWEDSSADADLVELMYTEGGSRENERAPISDLVTIVNDKCYYGDIIEDFSPVNEDDLSELPTFSAAVSYETGDVVKGDAGSRLRKFYQALSDITASAWDATEWEELHFVLHRTFDEQPQRIRQSKEGDYDSCPSDFYCDLDGRVTGLSNINQYPIGFTKNKTYRIEGIISDLGSGNMIPIKIKDNVGCINHKSVVQAESELYFAAQDGFYKTNGFKVDKISNQLTTTYTNFAESPAKIIGRYDNINKLVYWTISEGGVETDKIIVYGIESGEFFTYEGTFNPTAIDVLDGSLYRGDLLGYLFQHDENTLSDPTINAGVDTTLWGKDTITCTWRGIEWDFDIFDLYKWVTMVSFQGKDKETDVTLQLNSYDDGSNSAKPSPSTTVTTAGMNSTYTKSIYLPSNSLMVRSKQIELVNDTSDQAIKLIALSIIYKILGGQVGEGNNTE